MKIGGNTVIFFLLLTAVYSQLTSNWKKLPAKGTTNYFQSIFAKQTGVSSYYKYKSQDSQRIIEITLTEMIDGREKTLTMEIDLMMNNAQKYKKTEVNTNVLFKVSDSSNPLDYQKEIGLNAWSKQNKLHIIFEPKNQLIITSQKLAAGGYVIMFNQPKDSGLILTILSILLLSVVLVKELFRIRRFEIIQDSSQNIRIQALQIACGWFLKFAYQQSENYLNTFGSAISSIFILIAIIIFTIEFAYPCFSLDLSTGDKFVKFAIVGIFLLTDLSISGLIYAVAFQVFCMFFKESSPLKFSQCGIEIAYALVLNFIFDYLLFAPENSLGYKNNFGLGVLSMCFMGLEIILTFVKYNGLLNLPVGKISKLKDHFRVWSSGYVDKIRAKTLQINIESGKKEEDKLEMSQPASQRDNLRSGSELNSSKDI